MSACRGFGGIATCTKCVLRVHTGQLVQRKFGMSESICAVRGITSGSSPFRTHSSTSKRRHPRPWREAAIWCTKEYKVCLSRLPRGHTAADILTSSASLKASRKKESLVVRKGAPMRAMVECVVVGRLLLDGECARDMV